MKSSKFICLLMIYTEPSNEFFVCQEFLFILLPLLLNIFMLLRECYFSNMIIALTIMYCKTCFLITVSYMNVIHT